MKMAGIASNNNLINEAVKVEVFHSSTANIWTIQQKDINGFQVDSVEYEHKKANAIKQAEQIMNEIDSIKQVDIFTKENRLQKSIMKEGL